MEKAWLHQGMWQDLEGKLFWITGKVYQGIHNWCLSFVNILYSKIILLFAECITVKVCSGR
jgi:hypothetical protein